MIELSICISYFNSRLYLQACLDAIERNAPRCPYEVTVVDDGSDDPCRQMVQANFPWVQLRENRVSLGFAASNNRAITESKGRYVLILNSDAEVLPGSLDVLLAFMDSHPEVGAVGPKLLNTDGSVQPSCRRFPDYSAVLFNRSSLLTRLFPGNRYSRRYLRMDLDGEQVAEVDWLLGACMLVRRETLEDVGLLDEGFFMYGEDMDWCKRMWMKDWKVVYFPKAQVIHHFGRSTVSVPVRMVVERHKSIWRYYKKYFRRGVFRDAYTFAGVWGRAGFLLGWHGLRSLVGTLGSWRYPDARRAFVKRLVDICLSGVGLVISAPLWLLIGLSIKLEDRGPVFYSHDRIGRGGRRFRSWKFRSMVPDSDEKFGPLQARDGDPRVTRVGRFLRARALDELPQLWNIFVGDMSFVGPRALLAEEVEVNGNDGLVPLAKIPGYELRHRLTPGLTGLAQVYAARDLPRRQKFRYDLVYSCRQSLWLDVKLILVSLWITLRGRWGTREPKF